VIYLVLSCDLSCLVVSLVSCLVVSLVLVLWSLLSYLWSILSCLVIFPVLWSLLSLVLLSVLSRECALSCLVLWSLALLCLVVSCLIFRLLSLSFLNSTSSPPPYPDKLELSCYDLSCFVISLLLSCALTLKLCQPPPSPSTTNTAIVLSHTYASVNWLCRSIYSTESC
jgi:hypothetical protein